MNNIDKQFKILSPTAILGYGFPLESFMTGIREDPDLIAVDAGSVDPGPYYLGSGKSFTDKIGVKRDLRHMLKQGIGRKIPIIVGSCGGSGAEPHLEWCKAIVEEIAREEGLSFRLGLIYSDIDKQVVIEAIENNKIEPLQYLDKLTSDTVDRSVNIVAQIGVEPIIEAIKLNCDVILAGRAYDPAVFAALPIHLGYDPGLSMHLGKILECAAIAAEPGSGSDSVLGILGPDSFILKPLNSIRKFTRESTAAHSLYEKSNPYSLPGPGGALDLRNVSFRQLPDGQVEVRGSRLIPSEKYTVKIEGVQKLGYRAVSIAGSHDPIMIKNISDIINNVNAIVADILHSENIDGEIYFHIYGKNGVMGSRETDQEIASHEIGIVIESVSSSQEAANTICTITRSTLLHYGYAGRISTAGNLALPFSPSDLPAGEVYSFSIYHLMEIDNQDLFKIKVVEI